MDDSMSIDGPSYLESFAQQIADEVSDISMPDAPSLLLPTPPTHECEPVPTASATKRTFTEYYDDTLRDRTRFYNDHPRASPKDLIYISPRPRINARSPRLHKGITSHKNNQSGAERQKQDPLTIRSIGGMVTNIYTGAHSSIGRLWAYLTNITYTREEVRIAVATDETDSKRRVVTMPGTYPPALQSPKRDAATTPTVGQPTPESVPEKQTESSLRTVVAKTWRALLPGRVQTAPRPAIEVAASTPTVQPSTSETSSEKKTDPPRRAPAERTLRPPPPRRLPTSLPPAKGGDALPLPVRQAPAIRWERRRGHLRLPAPARKPRPAPVVEDAAPPPPEVSSTPEKVPESDTDTRDVIRKLPEEWEDKVAKAMATKEREATLATSVEGTALSRKDFGHLLPQPGTSDPKDGWLNDEIVNAWIAAIVDRKKDQNNIKRGQVPTYAAYNTGWYKDINKKGVTSIKTWSRRKHIKGEKLLECEQIFFPVNTGAHWMLLIIEPKNNRRIRFLDSIKDSGRKNKFFRIAREWLAMELEDKYVESEWQEDHITMSEQQANSNDCGVYVCYNALISAKHYEFNELHHKDMEEARKLMGAILMAGGFEKDWEL